jgi:DNA polymerase
MRVELDFETKSFCDLKKVGSWPYSQDPTTQIICLCYGLPGETEVRFWWPDLPDYPELPNRIEDAYDPTDPNSIPFELHRALFVEGHDPEAHNAAFEIGQWANQCVAKFGWPELPHSRWHDTMAVACYYAMPAALDRLAKVLGFEGKDPEGDRLITKYSKLHLKTAKPVIPYDDFWKFVRYCQKDVKIEQSVGDFLGDLPDRELPFFRMDFDINMRGLYLDEDGINMATSIVDQRAEILTAEFRELTGFNPTQRDKVMGWFKDQGMELESLKADYLEELMEEGELKQGPVRRALEIRTSINKASTKKLDAMLRNRSTVDSRARWQSRYHGTGTGRPTGSGFQPLNLNRGFEDMNPDQLVRDIMYGDAEWLDMIYGDAMDAIAKASRYWIMAEPGYKILAGDLVSVEAVGLACLAGEQWMIDAFASGAKIYELMGDKIYKLPAGTVTKKTHPAERQDGKTGELAFGYQGALGAWLKFDNSGRHSDERIIEICKAWRKEHPMIVKFWYGLEAAAIEAVRYPGRVTGYREIGFEVVDDWLSMILPNDKRIWYWKPQLRTAMPNWHKPMTYEDCANGTCDCRAKPVLTYMAQKSGQWKRQTTYGGKLAENATQATCRELMMPMAVACNDYGYHVILTVYDEVVSEVRKKFGSKKEFMDIMLDAKPRFADTWPISVDAWEGERYRK